MTLLNLSNLKQDSYQGSITKEDSTAKSVYKRLPDHNNQFFKKVTPFLRKTFTKLSQIC